jgi:mannose-6-phosphate isomerase-like protein (cupin superfamily)
MTLIRKVFNPGQSAWWRRGCPVAIGTLMALLIISLGQRSTPLLADMPEPYSPEESPSQEQIEAPFWVDTEAGTPWNIFGLEIVGKVMSHQTNGAYSVVMSTTPPAGGPPLHIHTHEDELFYILQGTYEFRCGDETILADRGDLVHLPAGLPHRFRNIGDAPGMTMNTMTPGGFEQFFVEIDQLPKDHPLDREQVATIAARYGLRFLPDR